MYTTEWIRSRAATRLPLNLHAVKRDRPDLLEKAFAGPSPHGWRRSLIDAGVDPYKIELQYEGLVECAICGKSFGALVRHLSCVHEMTCEEYTNEFGPDCETTSEACRAQLTGLRPIAGIAHWERVWSGYYVIDWLLRLHDEGHNLNVDHVTDVGMALVAQASKNFGLWDNALRAAGLDPAKLRSHPPQQQWTRAMVIEALRDFVNAKHADPALKMTNSLILAATRFFRSLSAACKTAGIDYLLINPRASFTDEEVAKVVTAIRTLEPLKGLERLAKLHAIYREKCNQRIVIRTYGSLQQLVIAEGIPVRLVAPEAYRDETDVHHDLDAMEREGIPLTYNSISKCNPGLNLVMKQKGWGDERIRPIERKPYVFRYPPCNPHSGRLSDRMILLRRKLGIGIKAAATKAGICSRSWGEIEREEHGTSAATRALIEKLLMEHGIP